MKSGNYLPVTELIGHVWRNFRCNSKLFSK